LHIHTGLWCYTWAMLQSVIRGAVALVLIPALLAGCGGGAKRISAPPMYGDLADLIAWVNVAPVEFHPGETVQVEVGVRNPTPHPIKVAYFGDCITFVVKDASGTTVAPGYACVAMPIPSGPFEVAPDEVIAANLFWDGTIAGVPLPDGDYQVGSAGLPVSATPVTIRILAP